VEFPREQREAVKVAIQQQQKFLVIDGVHRVSACKRIHAKNASKFEKLAVNVYVNLKNVEMLRVFIIRYICVIIIVQMASHFNHVSSQQKKMTWIDHMCLGREIFKKRRDSVSCQTSLRREVSIRLSLCLCWYKILADVHCNEH
jgi:hypothetical protein